MIAAIIRTAARHRLAAMLAVLAPCLLGLLAMPRVPIDAIPDLSDAQVIVYTEMPGQTAQIVEDQVTYPVSSAMLTVPQVRVVRGHSVQGASFVYVILGDGADVAAARVRVEQQLATVVSKLPAGVVPTLGPDATGVGWVYQYLVQSEHRSLAELRSIQDWLVRYRLSAIDGVAEVASAGGFVKSYSVVVDPQKLRGLGITLTQIRQAVRAANVEVGARSIQIGDSEFAVQGRGYLKGADDLARIAVRSDRGVPVLLADVARIEVSSEERRGLVELDGTGEVVTGIAVQRSGADTLGVVEAVKARLAEIARSLPADVSLKPVYDRSKLIYAAIANLRTTILEEVVIVALVAGIFLMHAPSALVTMLVMPAGILFAYGLMYLFGISANIMSLGGLAIAVGAMVDAGLVMVENAHKRLEAAPAGASRADIVVEAAVEVGPALFFSLVIIAVSFLPVLALQAEEGRLFRPLAYTKTFAMLAAALLTVTLVPAAMAWLGGARPSPRAMALNRRVVGLYRPVIDAVLDHKGWVVAAAILAVAASAWPASRLGGEFMPALNEGALFFMPTAPPSLSVAKAAELLQAQDRIIKSFPEVETVLGKAGRAQTATDPAPMEMFETLIVLKPESLWRPGMTGEKLVAELDEALRTPGIANSWTMPIRARIDMLSTGIRTTLGVKVFGDDPARLDAIAASVASVVRAVPGATSSYAERVLGGRYVNIEPDREALARYGLSVADVQQVLGDAVGGETITTTIEGRERYGVGLRLPRSLRDSPEALARDVLVALPAGKGAVPLGEIAKVSTALGPSAIRSENGRLVTYVYVDFKDRDLAGFVADARRAVAAAVTLPPGYDLAWSGQYEHLQRAAQRLAVVVPVTLLIIFLLLLRCFRRLTEALIVMLSLPFALVGGIWMMWWLGFHLSVASIVGFIALAGVAAETGVVMLVYLDHAHRDMARDCDRLGRSPTAQDIKAAVIAGAVERVRPKLMTVLAILAGLVPILWSRGSGADVMQRIAVPMIGGMVTAAVLTLIVIPAVYALLKQYTITRPAASPLLAN